MALQSASLRIASVFFGKETTLEFQRNINAQLCGGRLILV